VALYPIYVWFNLDSCSKNTKYAAFKDCLGALDVVFVPACVPLNMQCNYHSQKGIISQNILAAVKFNFEFVYVLSGLEGCSQYMYT
jgi:hypothetical protein